MAKGKFWSEFKEFAMKGNVIDMAVGVVIGGAFGKIVTSLVSDIIMPAVTEGGEVVKPEVAISWGNFLQVIFDFIIIALCIFLVIKGINKAKSLTKKEEAPAEPEAPAPKPDDVVLLEEIRDLLKNK